MLIHNKTKMFHSKSGSCALFGQDYEARRNLCDEEALTLFDSVFSSYIEPKIDTAAIVTPAYVRSLVSEAQSCYVNDLAIQKEFQIGQEKYVVQLEDFNGELALTQMWRIKDALEDFSSSLPSSSKIPIASSPHPIAQTQKARDN
jgi:hypothetical protein